MTKGYEVLQMLIPQGGWVITGNNWDGVEFFECEPITKKQFEDGFAQYDAWKAQKDSEKAASKQAILDRIGLTAEELQTILG